MAVFFRTSWFASILFRTRSPVRRWTSTAHLQTSGELPTKALHRLRPDLKAALASKSTTRLAVLRSILAQITNASKTSKPIDSDVALHALLQRLRAASTSATQEFLAAGREDLVAKERAQLEVLDEYYRFIPAIEEGSLKQIVADAVDKLQATESTLDRGKVISRVLKNVGGKPVEMAMLMRSVDDALA